MALHFEPEGAGGRQRGPELFLWGVGGSVHWGLGWKPSFHSDRDAVWCLGFILPGYALKWRVYTLPSAYMCPSGHTKKGSFPGGHRSEQGPTQRHIDTQHAFTLHDAERFQGDLWKAKHFLFPWQTVFTFQWWPVYPVIRCHMVLNAIIK